MKDSVLHQILIHLHNEDILSQNRVDITAFLISIRDADDDKGNNFNRIAYAIDKLTGFQFATFNYVPSGYTLGTNTRGVITTLDNTIVNATLELKGYDYIRNYIRENEHQNSVLYLNMETSKYYERQDEINKSIKGFNTTVKYTNYIAIIIAAITGFFIAMQLFKDDAKSLEPIRTQLERTVQSQDSTLQVQISIDSSLEKVARSVSSLKKK